MLVAAEESLGKTHGGKSLTTQLKVKSSILVSQHELTWEFHEVYCFQWATHLACANTWDTASCPPRKHLTVAQQSTLGSRE